METIKAKTILSKVKYGNEWYGIDYNMNLYRGCPIIYYTRSIFSFF